MTKTKKIGILGCGWLGLAAGQRLKEDGYNVRGSTTRRERFDELKAAGVRPYCFKLAPKPEPRDTLRKFLNVDIVIVAVPPARRQHPEEKFYPSAMRNLADRVADSFVESVLFVSSTSVYPNLNRIVTEEDVAKPEEAMNRSIFEAEEALRSRSEFETTVLRCGGLMGYDRIPGKYFQGKAVPTGELPVNFIHRDDAAGLIQAIIEQEAWGETFNAVAPLHPKRREVYERNAEQFGYALPEFVEPENPVPFKQVSGEKIIGALGYEFVYPDPKDFAYGAEEVGEQGKK